MEMTLRKKLEAHLKAIFWHLLKKEERKAKKKERKCF
jgi:hypothetical protein